MARVEVEVEDLPDFEGRLLAEGSFGYTADHAKYVNWDTAYAGTKPPFDRILGWTERKWNDLDDGLKLAPLSSDAGRASEIASEVTISEWQRRVAFMLQESIAQSGIEGVHFMERGAERARNDAEAIAAVYEGTDDPDASFKIIRDWLDYAFGISQDIIADEATDRGTLLQSGYAHAEQPEGPNEWEEE